MNMSVSHIKHCVWITFGDRLVNFSDFIILYFASFYCTL